MHPLHRRFAAGMRAASGPAVDPLALLDRTGSAIKDRAGNTISTRV